MKKSIVKRIAIIVTGLSVCCCLNGCNNNNNGINNAFGNNSNDETESASRDVFAMDTYMTVTAYGKGCETAVDEAIDEINRIDELLSVSNEDSEVYILNESGSEIVSDDTKKLIEASLDLYEKSAGAYDITIYPLMVKWGFTTGSYKVPSKDELSTLLKNVDAGKIEFDKESGFVSLPNGMQIDLGAIAKGYTSQRIMQIYENNGIDCGLVSLGGNIQAYGKKYDDSLWKIAIENPKDTADYIGVIQVEDKAVITSGGYERFFEEDGEVYHHIIDPKTGYPAKSGLSSVTIVSDDGMYADGLSTTLFVMGKEEAVKLWKQSEYDFEMVLVTDEGDIYITDGLKDSFSSEYEYEVIE